MKLLISVAALTIASLSGCATITRGSNDVLVVNSTPQGAQVELSNGMSCTSTPCTFKLPRRADIGVTISKAGCQTAKASVTHRTANSGAAGIAGNVLVGGVIGLGVDAATGASQELLPNPLNVELQCS
jgi:hypothetical protein